MKSKLLSILIIFLIFIIPFRSVSQITCLPPTGTTTTNITLSGATLSWTASVGAVYYMVQYRPVTNPVSAWINVTAQTTSVVLSNLACGAQYEWQVASHCSSNINSLSSYSPIVTFTTVACTTPCTHPTGLITSNITLSGATLSWTAPTGALAYVVQYRPVTTPTSAWTTLNATTTSVTLTNLACGTHYEWQVATYCGPGTNVISVYSPSIMFVTQACIVPCVPPTGLTTTNITLSGATLSWTASVGAVYYMIQYRPVTNPVSAWINVTAQTTSVVLSNLACGTHYEWQVASHCSSNINSLSSYSPIVSFTTAACTTPCTPPAGLITSSITLSGATLSWTAPTGALAYVVQYRPVTTPTSAWITLNATTTSVTLTNLACGTHYEWQVATYCGPGTNVISVYSPSIMFVTQACIVPCDPPTGTTTTNITLTGATLSWTASVGAVYYMVQYRPVTNPVSAWINVTAQTTSVVLSNLACGTVYEWQVASHCSSNINSLSSYSPIVSFTTLACTVPCPTPTPLPATNITQTSATLSWVASSGALAYMVQYRPIATPPVAWTTLSATTTSIVLSNLSCGTPYEWQVAAHCGTNTGNFSPYSPSLIFTSLSCTNPCLPPTGTTTTNITLSGATLSWTASLGAVYYMVQYRPVTNPVSAWINITAQTTSIVLSNLACGIQYEWQVASHCSSNINSLSSYSPIVSFTTAACTTPCTPPTGLITSNITLSGATLSWSASAGAIAYMVQYRKITNPVSSWLNLTTQNTSVNLTNLSCGTHYEWQVASLCGTNSGNFSLYSPSVTFTTLACMNSCPPPTGLTTTNISLAGATLSWIAPGGSLSYVVQYRKVTTPVSSWTTLTTQTTSVVLSNLSCGSTYQWRVARSCGNLNSGISPYSVIMGFTTLPCINNVCAVPTGLTSSAINSIPGSLMLSWNSTNAVSYKIRYKMAGTVAYTYVTSTTNSKQITGLTSGQYEWQVQSVCSGNIGLSYVSAWSAVAYFGISGQKSFFPNPVPGNDIHLPVLVEEATPMTFVITDRFGNTIKVLDKTLIPGTETLDLDVADLKNGIYFIQIKGENINEFQKIIIMR